MTTKFYFAEVFSVKIAVQKRAFKENIFSSLNNEFEMRFRFPYPLIYIRDQMNGNGREERSGKEQMRIKRGRDMTKTRFMQAAFETLQIALFILNFTKPHMKYDTQMYACSEFGCL